MLVHLHDLSDSEKHADVQMWVVGVWTYLLPHTDARGIFHADVDVIRQRCMKKRNRVHPAQIRDALLELDRVGLIHLYPRETPLYFVVHKPWKWSRVGFLKGPSDLPPPPLGLCPCIAEGRKRERDGPEPGPSPGPSSSFSGLSGSDSEKDPEVIDERETMKVLRKFLVPSDAVKLKHVRDLRRQKVAHERIREYARVNDVKFFALYDALSQDKVVEPARTAEKRPVGDPCEKCGGIGMSDYGNGWGTCPKCKGTKVQPQPV